MGQTVPEWKGRWANYKSDFAINSRRYSTELSKHIWQIKERGNSWKIEWRFLVNATEYNLEKRRCDICQREKESILRIPDKIAINRRREIFKRCHHKAKYLLINYTPGQEREKAGGYEQREKIGERKRTKKNGLLVGGALCKQL